MELLVAGAAAALVALVLAARALRRGSPIRPASSLVTAAVFLVVIMLSAFAITIASAFISVESTRPDEFGSQLVAMLLVFTPLLGLPLAAGAAFVTSRALARRARSAVLTS